MFNPAIYQNSNPAGAAFMEVVQHREQEERSEPEPPRQPVFMPLKGTHLSGEASGPVANLTITHRFGHPENMNGPVLEAIYRFPLPGDAAVTGVSVSFGDVIIRAELADRREAEQEYDDARATGRQAILLTRESPDVFSLHVSGIEAGQDVEVVTSYVQSLRPEARGFSLRVPLTPAPRFTSHAGRDGRHEHGQPLAVAHDPGHRFSMELTVYGVASILCKTHAITTNETEDWCQISLADGAVLPDRDLLLELAFPASSDRTSLQAFSHRDGEDEYFLALVAPPAQPELDQAVPREVILLVDRSGSMSGPKWEAADWAVRRFLSGLRPDDSFSLGLFHSDTRWFSRVCVPATGENIAAAQAFVDAYDDSGGTQLELALEEAITCGRVAGDLSRHIVIITDAQVSNVRDNLALARAESERSNRRRISMLCIDAAPNSWLVHELVAIGGGQASFLTSDPDEGDIATALDDVMSFWNQPVATGLKLQINRPDVWVMGRPTRDGDDERSDVDLGDLPAERPIWVVGRNTTTSEQLAMTLLDNEGAAIARAENATHGGTAIRAFFGARRLSTLEYQMEPSGWSRRRNRQSERAEVNLREQLVAESLRYGLACSETAFIAAREEAGKLVQRGAIVPNALPAGWDDGFALQSVYSSISPAVYSRAARDSQPRYSRESLEAPASMGEFYERRETGGTRTVFSGVPDISDGEFTLYEIDRFGDSGRLTALKVTIDGDGDPFDGELLLYVGEATEPRARVRLRDILNQHGSRPLNIRISRRDQIRLVMRDLAHVEEVPSIRIDLVWE